MVAGQDTILGTDRAFDALLIKINDDLAEYFVTKTEVTNARTSTVLLTTYASLDARLEAVEKTASAATSGSGVMVSANDAALGFLNGKLVAGEAIDLTEGVDGGDETLTISSEDATATNKGVASFNAAHFAVTSGAVSLSGESESMEIFYAIAF